MMDVRRLRRDRPPIVDEIERDGVHLAGMAFDVLIGGRRRVA